MGSFVNVGALVDGVAPKTKKALREAMQADPASVTFYATSMFDSGAQYSGDDLPAGKKLSVVGPNPYEKRSWYATVTSAGKVS